MRKTAIQLCLQSVFMLLFMLCVTSSAFSQPGSFTVFGPQQFDKPKGKPATYTESFQAPYPSGKHILWVESGTEGLDAAKNISVSVNGVEVIKSADLRETNPISKDISVQPDNTLSVTLKGKGGNFIRVTILRDPIRITSPMNGETINAPFTNVTGLLDNPSLQEIGIVVNGVPALVAGNDFIANHVPLVEGENILTVKTSDTSGNNIESDIQVYGGPVSQYIALMADEESGASPMDVDFTVETRLDSPVSGSELSCTGPGIPSISQASHTEYSALFEDSGLYICEATVIDDQSATFQDSIGINVISKETMDTLLQAKWQGMKDSLLTGDINTAASYFSKSSRAGYQHQFTLLQSVLPQVVNDMGDIAIIDLKGNMAIYDLRTIRQGETYSFQLMFIKDTDGIWRIRNF